eukprot:6057110-Alexandrium_andersonii.AAC.1
MVSVSVKLSWLCSDYPSRKQFRAVLSCLAKHSSPRSCQGQGRRAIVESCPPGSQRLSATCVRQGRREVRLTPA